MCGVAVHILVVTLIAALTCPVRAWADEGDETLADMPEIATSALDGTTLAASADEAADAGDVTDQPSAIAKADSETKAGEGGSQEAPVKPADLNDQLSGEDAATSEEALTDDVANSSGERGTSDAESGAADAVGVTDQTEDVDKTSELDAPAVEPATPAQQSGDTVVKAQATDEGGSGDSVKDQGTPLPQGAKSVKEGTYIFETYVANNMVLGVSDKTPDGHSAVTSQAYTGSNNQKWIVRLDEATGWYRILLSGTTRELALGKARNSEALELLYPEMVGDRALWAFVANSSWFNLVNRSMSDKLLAIKDNSKAEGAQLIFSTPSTTAARDTRRYYLVDTKPQVSADAKVTEGCYAITPQANGKITAGASVCKAYNGVNVLLRTDTNAKNQRIYLERDASGFYTAWVVGTGKVLDVKGSSLIPGTNIIQWAHTGKDNQKWALRSYGDGTYSLVNKATGLALGAAGSTNGSNLVATRNDGYKTTRFKLGRKPLLAAGIVEIHPRTNSKVTLDVKNAASSGTANLVLYTDRNSLNQRFELVSAGGTDLWRIRTASSGGWVTGTTTGVQQAGKGSTAKTKANTWQVTFKGGWYSLVNVFTGKALALSAGKTASGTKIVTAAPSGKDAQHFSFVNVNLIEPGVYMLRNGGSRYLTVAGASTTNGANVQVNKTTGPVGQVFKLANNGHAWTVQSVYSGLYMTAETAEWGANVTQKSGGTNKRQQWSLHIVDGGGIGFTSVSNGKTSLYAAGQGASEGANVWMAKTANGAGQSWKPISVLRDGTLTARQKKAISAAKSTPSPGGGLCAMWVTNVFERAGIGSWGGDARDQYAWFCKSANLPSLKPGMIIAVGRHNKSWAGSIWGHVGVYVGNGMVMDNIGYIRTISVLDWIDYYGEVVKVKWGWFGKSLA